MGNTLSCIVNRLAFTIKLRDHSIVHLVVLESLETGWNSNFGVLKDATLSKDKSAKCTVTVLARRLHKVLSTVLEATSPRESICLLVCSFLGVMSLSPVEQKRYYLDPSDGFDVFKGVLHPLD